MTPKWFIDLIQDRNRDTETTDMLDSVADVLEYEPGDGAVYEPLSEWFDALEVVQLSGATNMLDRRAVMELVGDPMLHHWLDVSGRKHYGTLLAVYSLWRRNERIVGE